MQLVWVVGDIVLPVFDSAAGRVTNSSIRIELVAAKSGRGRTTVGAASGQGITCVAEGPSGEIRAHANVHVGAPCSRIARRTRAAPRSRIWNDAGRNAARAESATRSPAAGAASGRRCRRRLRAARGPEVHLPPVGSKSQPGVTSCEQPKDQPRQSRVRDRRIPHAPGTRNPRARAARAVPRLVTSRIPRGFSTFAAVVRIGHCLATTESGSKCPGGSAARKEGGMGPRRRSKLDGIATRCLHEGDFSARGRPRLPDGDRGAACEAALRTAARGAVEHDGVHRIQRYAGDRAAVVPARLGFQ